MRQREIDKINRESERLWTLKYEQVPAKVGTIPMLIWITHDDAKMFMDGTLIGRPIRFCEEENGQIRTGYVTKLEPRLFIDRA